MSSSTSHRASPTIAVACLATAMLMLDISVINTALSTIAHSLSSGLGGLQWIVDAYTLTLAAFVLTAGSLADRFGRRRSFALGLVLFTGASAVCGLSNSIVALDSARAVQGVGAAILFAVSLALIAQVTPEPAARGKALALYGAVIGASFAVGPFVGGLLTDIFGWRAIFLVNVPLGLAALWITCTQVDEFRDRFARRVDWAGQLTLVGGLGALILGLLRANENGWSSMLVLTALSAGAFLVGAFLVIETVHPEPMLPLRLFRQPDFAAAQLSVFAIAASMFAIVLYLSIYLQVTLGRSPLETGLTYLPGSVLMFLVSASTPQFVARFGSGLVATIGLGLVTAGLLLLLLAGAESSWTVTLPATMTSFAGAGLYNPTIGAIALQALPERQSGLAAGAYDTFRQAGLALGTAALGTLLPASGVLGGRADAYVTGLHHAAIVAAALSAAGGIALVGLIVLREAAPVALLAEAAEG